MSDRRATRRDTHPFRVLRALITWLCLFPLVGREAAAQVAPTDADVQLARTVTAALKQADTSTLIDLIDLERRGTDRFERGADTVAWADLDAEQQALERDRTAREWVTSNAALQRRATLIDVAVLDDPDAASGRALDRRLVRATVRDTVSGMHCDVVIVATSEARLLEVLQSEAYDPAAGTAGDLTRSLADLSTATPRTVIWPPDIDDFERRSLYELVEQILTLPDGQERELALEYLHRNPRPAVAALVATLAKSSAADAQAKLSAALSRITGRRAGDGGAADVDAWLRWHHHRGRDFQPTEVAEPLDRTVAEGPGAPPDDTELERWSERLKQHDEQPEAPTVAAGGTAPGQPAPSSGTGDVGAGAQPGSVPADPEHPAGAAGGTPATGPAPKPPTVTLPTSSRDPKTSHADSARDLLFPAAADLEFTYGKRVVSGREIEASLSPAERAALNAWAEAAQRLELQVIVGTNAEYLVLGHGSDKLVRQVAEWMDDTWTLLDPALPIRDGLQPKATVAIVFDEKFTRSDAWGELLDLLVEQRAMMKESARSLSDDPGGLTLRSAPLFLQPSWDMAGNAAAGDDEFRLGNEIANKFAQCLVTTRLSQQPKPILWGLGYVAEQQLFKSTYQLNTAGFVSTGDHFDWPVRTRQELEKRSKSKDFSLARFAVDEASAGTAQSPQMVTWATLAYLADKDVPRLHALLSDLSNLQAEHERYGSRGIYEGDPERTLETLREHLDPVEPADLIAWLKKR